MQTLHHLFAAALFACIAALPIQASSGNAPLSLEPVLQTKARYLEGVSPDFKLERIHFVKHEQERAQKSLENFINRMRTFVLKDTFDVENFELQTAELHEALKQISAWVHKVTPPNELSASVRFAHHILTIMTNYLPAFKHYGACSLSHSRWVYKMMHFNLCLLLLCDYQGGINKKDSWYSERVFKAWVRLYLWKRKLKNQTDVPGDVKYLYETEITKAEQGIAFLTSQLPDMEPWDDSEFLLLSRIE